MSQDSVIWLRITYLARETLAEGLFDSDWGGRGAQSTGDESGDKDFEGHNDRWWWVEERKG